MDRAALRLSLLYGRGDLHWFENLSPEDQAAVLAFHALDIEEAEAALEEARAGRAKGKGKGRGGRTEPRRGDPGALIPGVTCTPEGRAFWFGEG